MDKRKGFTPLEGPRLAGTQIKVSNGEKRASKRFLTGFTLLELLVVIAIIAMLMAILMPALGKVKKQAMKVACQATLHQWAFPFSMYCDDNDGLFSGGEYDPASYEVIREHEWVYNLRSYYKDMDVALCPAAQKTWCQEDAGTFTGWDFRCLEDYDVAAGEFWPYYEGTYGSYGKNSWCSAWPYHGNCPDHSSPHACNWLSIRVKRGNRIPLFLDSIFMGGFPEDTGLPPEYEGQTFWSGSPGGGGEMDRYIIPRHDKSVNSLFVDLSVREVGLKELYKLKWHRLFNINEMWTIGFDGDAYRCAALWDGAAPWMSDFPEY